MNIDNVFARQKNKPGFVVGIVDSPAAIAVASGLSRNSVDCLEWRADCLPERLRIPPADFPWILTVRHFLEGGKRKLTAKKREEIFAVHLSAVAAVDIELRSFRPLSRVVAAARSSRVKVVASFHDFQKTPTPGRLRDLMAQARDHGADIFKIATRTDSPADVIRLLDLFEVSPIPLSVMGMGRLGFGSRILLAQCGSVLNYGWLHRPNVPGQWAAVELKRILGSR